MSEDINPRIRDILDSVILYVSHNEPEKTTDCYLKCPDGSKEFVKYGDQEFFDTLSYCLDATIDGSLVYCRHYTNKKGEVIKFENPIIINGNNVDKFIKKLENTKRFLSYKDNFEEKEIKIVDILNNISPYKEQFGYKCKLFFSDRKELISEFDAYEEFLKELNGKEKNENEFYIDSYKNAKGVEINLDVPVIISKEYIEWYVKILKLKE